MHEDLEAVLANSLSEKELAQLPKWVQENIETAVLIGSNYRTVLLKDGQKFALDNKINDLNGAEWTKNLVSVINTNFSTKGKESYAYEIRKVHPTPKPPQLMKEIITFFTKENEIVFDYFMGVGGSLIGAALCNRRGMGIDLNEEYINAYKTAALKLNLPIFPCFSGDSNKLLEDNECIEQFLNKEKVGLILIDPPYANMMAKPKTGADVSIYGNIATPFTDSLSDIGNGNYQEFLSKLKEIVNKSLK